MMGRRNKDAQKRYNEERKSRRHAKEAAAKAAETARQTFVPPVITEADLLNFQLTHFGDDTCPGEWFVNAEVALTYDPAEYVEEEDDDGLGYYEDGVKRTLTDEQIEMFRHTEMEMLAREKRLREENPEHDDDVDMDEFDDQQAAVSPLSGASSIDEDLMGLAKSASGQQHTKAPRPRKPSTSTDVPTSFGTSKASRFNAEKRRKSPESERPMKKQRLEEVPYEERNKRKWEEHIATVDPVKGTWMYDSKTTNRLRRELDEIKSESVELDY